MHKDDFKNAFEAEGGGRCSWRCTGLGTCGFYSRCATHCAVCTRTNGSKASCTKCDNTKAYFYQLQIRSADEPMTTCASYLPLVLSCCGLTSMQFTGTLCFDSTCSNQHPTLGVPHAHTSGGKISLHAIHDLLRRLEISTAARLGCWEAQGRSMMRLPPSSTLYSIVITERLCRTPQRQWTQINAHELMSILR